MMKTLAAMFKNLYKEIKIEFIRAKLDSEENTREWQRKINKYRIMGYEIFRKLYY